MIPPIQFDVDDAQRAADAWGFNCGPAAIAAILCTTPEQIRPHLSDFEHKGYMNPSMVFASLRLLQRPGTQIALPDKWTLPVYGLARIQWGGPWLKEGVPIAARYQHTHWIAAVKDALGPMVFDVNSTCAGWITFHEWAYQLVPWLLGQHKRADGSWYVTHAIEVPHA